MNNERRASSLVVDHVASAPTFDEAVAIVEAHYDFRAHPYFVWMRDARTTRDEFRQSQLAFRFVIEAFSRSLAAVLARVPRLEQRLALFDNIAEEHGRGRIEASHRETYVGYLRALGATDDELATPCPTSSHAFNEALLGFCLTESYEAGAAMVGIIERLYVGISHDISRTIHERGWVAPDSQRHYDVHAALDVSHSRELFELAAPGFGESRMGSRVAMGLLLGAHHFWRLYSDYSPDE